MKKSFRYIPTLFALCLVVSLLSVVRVYALQGRCNLSYLEEKLTMHPAALAEVRHSHSVTDPAMQAERLFEWFKAASGFDRTYPREKVYLHLDNSAYLENDSIWYKAYVVRASSLLPTTLSRVLYVELLNADGQLVEKQTLRLDSLGQADGCFKLKLPVRAGYYEIRAYTREMTNWGENACFSRVIPVFTASNPQRKLEQSLSTNIADLSIPEPTEHGGISIGCPRPYIMKESKERLLEFYPEGGLRAKGVEQRIAYKLTDGRGQAVEDTLQLFDDDGQLIGETSPEYEGMGSFLLPAQVRGGYALLKDHQRRVREGKNRFTLPEATQAYVIATKMGADGLDVTITANDSALTAQSLLGLAVICREKTCYFDTLTVPREGLDIFVPRKALRAGVNRVELFDVAGHSQCTRLVWVQPNEAENRHVTVHLSQNKAEYGPFEPAALRLQLTDAKGNPVKTTLSVAVRDLNGNITDPNDGGLVADLLLSSELRGYVARPDLYFQKNDAAHRRMLDLLLMVQGWTANTFSVMCGADTFRLRQPIEDRLLLRGGLYTFNRRAPQSNFSLNFRAYSLKGNAIEGTTRTDSLGRFAFESMVDFNGDYIGQFNTRDSENKKRWSRLTLDRWFAPEPRPFTAADLDLKIPVVEDSIVSFKQVGADKPELFEWTDTLSRISSTLLKGVEVKAKRKYHGFTGNRFSYGGGPQHGMKAATKFYNAEWMVEHAKDLGIDLGEVGNLVSLLEVTYDGDKKNRGWDYLSAAQGLGRYTTSRSAEEVADPYNSWGMSVDKETGQVITEDGEKLDKLTSLETGSWNELFKELDRQNNSSHSLKVYYNNRPAAETGGSYDDLLAEEVKYIAVVTDPYATDAVTGESKRNSTKRYSVYIYTIPDFYRYRSKRGVDRRRIQGFTVKTNFYAPNYRTADLPSDKDIRRTLHWDPSVQTDENGQASLLFFTNSRDGQTLDVSVRGVSAEGGWIE